MERGYIAGATAVERTLATLRLVSHSPQVPEVDATGNQGFYYHSTRCAAMLQSRALRRSGGGFSSETSDDGGTAA
jgi:hypothetical protein